MKLKHGLLCGLVAMGGLAFASAPVLTWSPSGAAVWDLTSENWLDGSTPSAWKQGAVAAFDGGGGIVEVPADVSASGLVFDTGGYTLVGGGRIRLEGELSVASGMTNSVGTELFSASGIAKKGGGAVALGMCVGRVTVEAGDVLATASTFADAQVLVEQGGRLVTTGGPDRALNVVRNGGFEELNMSPGQWQYVSTGANLTEWGVAMSPNRVGGQNLSVGGSPWNSPGTAPEGAHVLILQMNGAVTQAVTVAQAGWYQVAFCHFLRNTYPETAFYVTLDDVAICTILNEAHESLPKRFVSVPLWLEVGEYVLGLASEGYWEDRASMIDDVVLGPAFAVSGVCRALGGESSVTLASGATAVLNHSGNVGIAKLDDANGNVTGGGTWSETLTGFWFEYANAAWNPSLDMGEDALVRIKESASVEVEGLARRVWVSDAAGGAFLTGEELVMTNAVSVLPAQFTVSDTSEVRVAQPTLLRRTTHFDVFGSLVFEDWLATTNTVVSKRGFGEMSITQPLGLQQNFNVLEGRVNITSTPLVGGGTRGGHIYLLTLPGRTAEVRFTEAGALNNLGILFCGMGQGRITTDLGGGFVSMNHPRTMVPLDAEFAIPDGDTFSIAQLLVWVESGLGDPTGGLLKTGPGTLEIREGGNNTSNNRAHRGRVTLRNGTLRVFADDTGPYVGTLAYNGAWADGRGGSLGRGALTDAVRVGDTGTLPTDNLAFIASGNKRYIGHDFEVFDFGDDVRFEVENSTDTRFAGTFILHRDVTFAGPLDAHLTLASVVTASGYQGTDPLTFEGFSHITILDALNGAGINLDLGARTLRVGVDTVQDSFVNSLTMDDGIIGVNIGGGECSTLHADTVTLLGKTVFNLYLHGTDFPFCETGTFTLMTANTLNIDTEDLTVANLAAGFSYAFEIDGDSLVLTVQNNDPSTFTAWASKHSGDWDTGANWDTGTVPNDSGVTVLFGSILTNNATVTLESPFVAGSLLFNNTQWNYTLAGDALTLGNAARLDVLNGSHTIRNTLDAGGPLRVAVSGGALRFDAQGKALAQVVLEQGALLLADEAALLGGLEMDTATALTVNGSDIAIGTRLEGDTGARMTLQGGSKLTVGQTVNGAFGGLINAPVNTEIVRTGNATWELDAYRSFYEGVWRQETGETVLTGVSLAGSVLGSAGTELTFAPSKTNGLMGFYYYVGNANNIMLSYTNLFLSVEGLESLTVGRRPDLSFVPSGEAGENFDFPLRRGDQLNFPYPFGGTGPNGEAPHMDYFFVVWRGSITVPETGFYSFGIEADDYVLFAIDGDVLHAANRYISGTHHRTRYLREGRHDILVGLGQATGNVGIRLWVRPPSETTHILLPNDWLTPMATVGALNSAGDVTLLDNVNVRVGEKGVSAVSGVLSVPANSLLEKVGTGSLDLLGNAPNAVEGSVNVRDGSLVLRTPERLGAGVSLTLDAPASLAVLAPQTVGTLSGKGQTFFGGGALGIVPFADDTDCGISPAKTYTHLLDFPLDLAPATVNGVTFGVDAGSAFTSGPTSVIDPNHGLPGVARLLSGFYYARSDYTLHLSGLQAFTAYELRLYFQRWDTGSPDRNVTFTFTVGGNEVGEITSNIDLAGGAFTRHFLQCNYVTDSTGTLDIRILSLTGATCHLFALSNEYLGDVFSDLTLTLDSPAGADALYGGNLEGVGTLVKTGDGIQRFGGANRLSGALEVLAGEVVLEPGAAVSGIAEVGTGATLTVPLGDVTLGGLTGEGGFAMEKLYSTEMFYQHFFTDDATSQISTYKRYTHKLDLGIRDNIQAGSPGVTVNDVTFTKADINGVENGYGWYNIGRQRHGGDASLTGLDPSQGIHALFIDMTFNIQFNPTDDPIGIMRLTGLTPGQQYEVRFYNRIWNTGGLADGLRKQTLSFIPDPAVTNVFILEQDAQPHNFLAYRYTPTTDELTILVQTHATNSTWHIYALTNEEAADGPVVFDTETDSTFDGTVTGEQPWAKRGPATFTLTGLNTVTGPLTVEEGAFGVALNGIATLGPVLVEDGARLFGQGTIGGAVDIAPGAILQAGTASACGILTIGGDLTIQDGANVDWGYASTALADTFNVNGALTLAATATVHAQAFAQGVRPPAKWLLFSSPATIDGPTDFNGWVVNGLPKAKLSYSVDKTKVYMLNTRGTVLILK